MNTTPPNFFKQFAFECAHCRHRSKLNLTECPECGRIKPASEQSAAREAAPPREARANAKAAAFLSGAPPRNTTIYECAHCRYQTLNRLVECPGCGRPKFDRFEIADRPPRQNNLRHRNAPFSKSETGKFLLIMSTAFWGAALMVFLGFGPGPHHAGRRRGAVVAAVGENWHIAAIPLVIAIAMVVVGLYLKDED